MFIKKSAANIQMNAQAAAALAHEVLEPAQFSNAKQHMGQRVLDRKTLILLWGMRAYVVFMIVLIGMQVWNAAQFK